MSLDSAVLARRMRLPCAQTHDVVCERDLRVTMDDGAVLLADRWVARATRDRPQPTVLVRSPYGRRQLFGLIFGRLLAERGLQVVIQSVRGTFGSEGQFSPFDERADGRTRPLIDVEIRMSEDGNRGYVVTDQAPDCPAKEHMIDAEEEAG